MCVLVEVEETIRKHISSFNLKALLQESWEAFHKWWGVSQSSSCYYPRDSLKRYVTMFNKLISRLSKT